MEPLELPPMAPLHLHTPPLLTSPPLKSLELELMDQPPTELVSQDPELAQPQEQPPEPPTLQEQPTSQDQDHTELELLEPLDSPQELGFQAQELEHRAHTAPPPTGRDCQDQGPTKTNPDDHKKEYV